MPRVDVTVIQPHIEVDVVQPQVGVQVIQPVIEIGANMPSYSSGCSGCLTREESGLFYPASNPSGFPPDHFGEDLLIIRSGEFIKEIQYADGSRTEIFYNANTQVTGIDYGSYRKLILYSGDAVTGIKYV